jgi:hypothetical protein
LRTLRSWYHRRDDVLGWSRLRQCVMFINQR